MPCGHISCMKMHSPSLPAKISPIGEGSGILKDQDAIRYPPAPELTYPFTVRYFWVHDFLFQRWKPHGISRSLEGLLPQLQHFTFRRTAKSDAVHTFNGGNVKTLLRWVRIFPMNRSTTCDDPFGGGTPGNPPCLSTWFFRRIVKLNF